MIGDGYAMGVAAQILEHILRATEGWFRVHHPVLSEQRPKPSGEGLGLSQRCEVSPEAELTVPEGLPEGRHELATKDTAEHLDGKKERVVGLDPERVVERQPTGGNHAMDMRVEPELLIPGVQNAEEADHGTEMFGIASDFEKCFRTGAKQKIVEDLLVLQSQWRQLTR